MRVLILIAFAGLGHAQQYAQPGENIYADGFVSYRYELLQGVIGPGVRTFMQEFSEEIARDYTDVFHAPGGWISQAAIATLILQFRS